METLGSEVSQKMRVSSFNTLFINQKKKKQKLKIFSAP